MLHTNPTLHKAKLLLGVAPLALVFGAVPAFAQDAPATATVQSDQGADTAKDDIVVTGSLFRRTDTETPSPVTILTTDDLEKRGINTVQGAIQSLNSNNGPALTNSFSANGAFAGGASAVSLRGLTTSSTLVLFDGLRAAYYPLADDGTRNFVDLNTIPDEIVERVEVLKDGASSTYGADAVAGVVNIITKKQVKGLYISGESGITQQGDAANQRLSATYGYGDLSEKGFNAYISGHYIHSAALYNKDRGYPFNTDNLSNVCYQGTCGPNNILNGVTEGNYNGLSTGTTVTMARPFDATNTTAQGAYQLLNPALGCQGLTSYTLTDAQYAKANSNAQGVPLAVPVTPRTVCQQDVTHDYGQIEPESTRWGASGRATVQVGDNAQAYAELNYEQSRTSYTGLASIYRTTTPPGASGIQYTNSSGASILTLPIYVCAARVNCTAANGTLNPNNPFAAQGEVARIIGRLPTSVESNTSLSQVYRGALGISGGFGDGWNYAVDGTAMVSKLKVEYGGYVNVQHLNDVIADGSYNWMNPSANSQAVLDYLTPGFSNDSQSELYQGQASLSKDLLDLPGGPLQAAIGAALRYESIYAPSANPDINGGATGYFRVNPFGAIGNRTVESAYFEVNAPVFRPLEVNVSGRFDNYSSGQSNFSPKIGMKFTPIKQFALRGTYSRGFRIPSFAESGALPTTGYVSVPVSTLPASFLSQYGANCRADNPNGCPAYLTSYSVGQTAVGTSNLKPEKSRNFTVGAIFEPIKNVSFTVDYYNIRKTDAITTANYQPAIDAYYAGQPIPAGYTVTPDAPDVNNPTAMPRIAYVAAGFVNANEIKTSGLDFSATAKIDLGSNVRFTTKAEATYIINLDTTFADGTTQHYAGTLGNFNLTAGSGTQRWKGTWQNTLDVGKASLTATAYYTSGYNLSAEDQGGVAGDCGLSSGYTPCNVSSFITVDLTGSVAVNDNFTFYVNVLNALGAHAPLDPVTYGAYMYNPVQAEAGILGRSFRAGFRAKF